MIVVDSSALVAIALDEPAAESCMRALHQADGASISAGTVAESLIVAAGRGFEAEMTALLDGFGLVVEPVTDARARAAARAYRQYGKGWHPAALNFGDCFAYALALELGCPLLYVGNDFAKTDVAAAIGQPQG